MVTDMVGFAASMDADQDDAVALLDHCHGILQPTVAKHSGEWKDDAGDRTLTIFPSAVHAVECALDIHGQLKAEPHLKLRIGIDIGEILVAGSHIYGDTVNIASFIERLADPGGLVITEAVFESAHHHINLQFVDLGEKMLKNVAHGVRLYALTGLRQRSRLGSLASGLMVRRVPHITGAYLAASWAVVEVAEWLANNGLLDYRWVYAVSVGLLSLIPSVLLIAYAHGAHGRERLTGAERFGVPLNLLLAAMLMTMVYERADVLPRATPIQAASVAVLPFINLNSDEGGADFGLGLSEELVNALAKVPGLYVASRTSSSMFIGKNQDPRDIARKLGVATILEGSVRKQDNQVRVTAQLIDGRNNYHLWSETFDRELVDIFRIQESIARSVATELVGVLQPDVVVVISEAQAATVEAYDFYVQGLGYLRQAPTQDSLDNARKLFERTLVEDPGYAQAYAALCEVALERFILDRSASLIDEARSRCYKALSLDGGLRDVRFALGQLYRYTGDYEESAKIFRELLDTQPTANAWVGLGETNAAQGMAKAAEQSFENAVRMEPGNWRHRMALAEFLYSQARYEESLEALRRVLELSPDNPRAHLVMAASYDYLGDLDASIKANLKAIELEPTRGAYRDLGLTYYSLADFEKAADAFQQAVELGGRDHVVWGNLAATYRMLGNDGGAAAAYARAIELAIELLERNPRDWVTLSNLAVYNVMSGDTAAGIERIKTAVAEGSRLAGVHYDDALIQMQLGRPEQALAALERSVALGTPVRMITTEPTFHGLENNDRFRNLIENQPEE